MQAKAIQRYIRQAPKKVRQVVDLVKGKRVEEALNILHFTDKKSAEIVEKTLRSAVANFMSSNEESNIDPEDLYVHEAYVNSGPTLKRWRPRSMGRANIIRRRSSHLTLVVSTKRSDSTK